MRDNAILFFESPEGWMPLHWSADLKKFRGGEPLEILLTYEDGSVFRWLPAFKPRGLLARLWNEAKLWWEGR